MSRCFKRTSANVSVSAKELFLKSDLSSEAHKYVAMAPSVPRTSESLLKEIGDGRIAGPFQEPTFPNFRVSPLGIIPKKELNTYRLIHHLSYPYMLSLNDKIDPNYCLVHYSSFADALRIIRSIGSSALLAKANIKSAFRLCPYTLRPSVP